MENSKNTSKKNKDTVVASTIMGVCIIGGVVRTKDLAEMIYDTLEDAVHHTVPKLIRKFRKGNGHGIGNEKDKDSVTSETKNKNEGCSKDIRKDDSLSSLMR